MAVRYVMHSADVGVTFACSNMPNQSSGRRMTVISAIEGYEDIHSCPECLGDTDGNEDILVEKKRKGAKWHRPDAAGVCADCGQWVPEDRR